MPIRPEINLMAEQVDPTTVFPLFQQARQAQQRNQLFPLQKQITEVSLNSNKLDLSEQRRQALINSVVNGSAQVKPLIDAGDIEGTMNFLLNRKTELEQQDLPTETTDGAIELLQTDPEAFKRTVDANVAFGIQKGILGRGSNVPANIQNREDIISSIVGSINPKTNKPFTEEEARQEVALRESGIVPRAVGSSAITTAQQGLTDQVAESESTIKDRVVRADQNAKNSTGAIKDFFEQLGSIESNILNYNEAIELIDQGAATGVVQSRLPSVRAASQKLDNVKNRLGLDVVGNTTFGALSEKELAFATDVGLPTNLEGQELRKWLVDKKAAQEKLASYLSNAMEFLNIPGNSLADLQALSPRQDARADTAQDITQEDLEFTARKHGISVEEVKKRLGAQ